MIKFLKIKKRDDNKRANKIDQQNREARDYDVVVVINK